MYPTERLWTILEGSRLAKHRREALRKLVEDLSAAADRARADGRRTAQEAKDLRIHLRDRDRHIANLEAEARDRMGVGA